MASTFAKAFAAGRGAAAKAGARGAGGQGRGRGAAPKAAPAAPVEDEGKVTCANRGLLQQMLSGVLQEPSDGELEEEPDEPDPLGMSLRTVHPHPQGGRNVPTITSPPSGGRPGSRGGPGGPSARRVSIGSLESHARPASRDGPSQGSQQRSAPSTARVQKVQTGAPRPAITSYVSGPRPGSRGAGGGAVPPAGGEVCLGPGGWQKPLVRPAVQPKSGKAAGAAGYAGLHQAKAKPQSPAGVKAAPAAKPRCGPAAFQLIKKVETQAFSQASSEVEPEEDEEGVGFVLPESDEDLRAGPEGSSEGFVMPGPDEERTPAKEDAAAAYVAQLKKSMGLQAVASEAAPLAQPQRGDVHAGATTAQARARSSDTRGPGAPDASSVAPLRLLPRSRSSDPRAHIAAARAMTSHESDEEEDEEDEPTTQGFQWKAGIRGLVKQFAQEERARMASPSKSMSPVGPKPEDEPVARRPPRAPGPPIAAPPERQKAAADEEVALSKKPRVPVEYTPATVEEYKQRFGGNAAELGRLGPDLDDDGLLMKRAIQEKVKQFSKELHRVNKQRAERTVPPKQPQPKPEPKSTARAKAREFAKNIPKPKLAPPKQVLVTPTKIEEDVVQDPLKEAMDWEDIRRRERQHFEDAAKVAAVKDFLDRLAV